MISTRAYEIRTLRTKRSTTLDVLNSYAKRTKFVRQAYEFSTTQIQYGKRTKFYSTQSNTRNSSEKAPNGAFRLPAAVLGMEHHLSGPGILGAALMSALRNKYVFGPGDQPMFMRLSGHRLRSTTTQKLVSYLVAYFVAKKPE